MDEPNRFSFLVSQEIWSMLAKIISTQRSSRGFGKDYLQQCGNITSKAFDIHGDIDVIK